MTSPAEIIEELNPTDVVVSVADPPTSSTTSQVPLNVSAALAVPGIEDSVVTVSSAGAPRSSVRKSLNQTETQQVSEIEKLRKELEEMKKKAGVNTVDGAISSLQALVGRPTALFDAYAAIAALEEVVYTAQKLNDERATKFNIILRKCRPLVVEPSLQPILTTLVASKEEAEIAKTIDKAIRLQNPTQVAQVAQVPLSVLTPPFRFPAAGRTIRATAPYTRRNRGPRRCFVCNAEGHIARFCPTNSLNVKRR